MKSTLLLLVVFLSSCTQTSIEDIPVIDSHIHFFDTDRPEGVMWPPKDRKVLHTPTLPKHYKQIARENNVQKAVVVQASNWVSDAKWNLKVTENEDYFYAGIVCNLSTLGSPHFKKDIDILLQDPRIVGLRITHPPKHRPFYTSQLIDDLKYIASKNLSLDILAHRFDSTELIKIAKQIPELNIMIGLSGKKEKLIIEMGKLANVHCKYTVPLQNPSMAKDFELIWKSFGTDRIVFGSNWPGTKEIQNGYNRKKQNLFNLLEGRGEHAIKKVFYENAMRFYQLENGRSIK